MEQININKPGKSSLVMIYVPVGSRFENDNKKGISHFTEHMMFKGTPTRNAKQIAKELEQYGAQMNAFTGEEFTCYYVKISNVYRKKAVAVLLDMIQNSVFNSKEINKEREVIIQEIKMYDDDPRTVADIKLTEKIFPVTSGLHLPIGGSKETVKNIFKKDFLDFYKKHYNNYMLIQIGDIKEKSQLEYSPRLLRPETFNSINKNPQKNTHYYIWEDMQQSNIKIGYALNLSNTSKLDKIFIVALLKAIYNDMSGRLFTTVREKNHLVYRVNFDADVLACGAVKWNVALGLDKDKIEKARDIVIKELTKPVGKEELKYIITKLLGEHDLYSDDTMTIAGQVITCRNLEVDYKEVLYKYKKHIRRIAKNINDYIKAFNFYNHLVVGVVPGDK